MSTDASSVIELSCGIPPNGINTEIPSDSIVYHEVYHYVCEVGHETNNSLSTECLANGTFSLVNPPNCASEFLILSFFLNP